MKFLTFQLSLFLVFQILKTIRYIIIIRLRFLSSEGLIRTVMQCKKQNYKIFFEKFQGYHFAAHSHHPWPDVTFEAQKQSWIDTATKLDHKWDKIFSKVIPQAQCNIAKLLNITDPQQIAFGTNTFEFILRIISCFNKQKIKILTSDSEFHSFRRTVGRLIQDDLAQVTTIQNALQNFQDRIIESAYKDTYDLIFFSHVFFNSGKVNDIQKILDKLCQLPKQTFICVDGYHSVGAITVDIKRYQNRIFYLGGGYKYLQSGEGCGFCYVPTDYQLRPRDTGWYASFETLDRENNGKRTQYSKKGIGFMGATFDPTALYRLNSFFTLNYNIQQVFQYVKNLQIYFIEGLKSNKNLHSLYNNILTTQNGSFVSIQLEQALIIQKKLQKKSVTIDRRNKNLRFGFGVYQDNEYVDNLLRILDEVVIEVEQEKVKVE